MIGIGRDSNLTGEIVCGAERNDAERDVVAIEAVDDFIEGPIAAAGNDDVDTAPTSRVGSERGRGSLLECGVRLNEMTSCRGPNSRGGEHLRGRRARHGTIKTMCLDGMRWCIAHITRLFWPLRSSSFFGDAERVLDCTLGGGGHSEALLVAPASRSVVGVDRDPDALGFSEPAAS